MTWSEKDCRAIVKVIIVMSGFSTVKSVLLRREVKTTVRLKEIVGRVDIKHSTDVTLIQYSKTRKN